MELIDKDKLKEKLISLIKFYNATNNYGAITGVSSALSEIDDMKTTDGLVHAKWIEKPFLLGTSNFCSLCGENFGMPHGKFNFCPNCGVKMDLEEE